MKRIALLIGNSNGLPGVKKDIAHWIQFLESDQGGQWTDDEIIISMNPAKYSLLLTINRIKASRPDFAIVVFSGHGAYQKNTILEINENEEVINEDDLIGIASRQISVFDCCRNILIENLSESHKSMRMFSDGGSFKRNIRPYYDARIMSAIEQQIRLYACSVNESALDTGDGGLYTTNLLKCSSYIPNSYKLVGIAHEEAREHTVRDAILRKHTQNPDSTLPKCLSSQQLIIAINPNNF